MSTAIGNLESGLWYCCNMWCAPNARCPKCGRNRPGSTPVATEGAKEDQRLPEHGKHAKAAKKGKERGPNATENGALHILPAFDWVYEGLTFDVAGGGRYTPDWVDVSRRIAVEAKGEHIHSRDSRRRFDEARERYPHWVWIWARRRTCGRKGHRWEVEIYNWKG